MKRVFGVMAVMALVAGASAADAQQFREREVLYNKFDLGLYGGGAWTSDWFSIGEADFGSGWSPVFGATGTYWFNQRLGARLNGSYMPMRAPTTNADVIQTTDGIFDIVTPSVLQDRSGWPVNTWMADLSLTYKPWLSSSTNFLASTYLWLGGGALWSNFAGRDEFIVDIIDPIEEIILEEVDGCVPEYLLAGICYDSGDRTVGQLTFGLGFDLISLGSKLGLYGELGGNVYRAPVRNGFEGVLVDEIDDEIIVFPNSIERKTAFTGRATAGVKFAFGEVLAPVVPIPPPPPPPAPAERTIQVCVVDNGQLEMISAIYRPATGDTLVGGQPFTEVHPATVPNYAAGANWYLQSSEITFMDNAHVKYGVTRMITPSQLQRVGEYQGTPVFAEAGTSSPWEVVYLPVRPGCEFQPYQLREVIRPRG